MEDNTLSKSTNNSPLCIHNVPERPEKFIAFALRHKAIELGLDIDEAGFVNVEELISLPHAQKFHFTLEGIKEFVRKDKKKRYQLVDRPPLFIRAVQGHSIRKVSDDNSLNLIDNIFLYPIVAHGTYHNAWEFIKNTGLNRMSRNDIHFSIGYPNDDYVLSGMKNDTEVIVEINAPLAWFNDIKVYISSNRVILSPGVDGVIPTPYFKKVVDYTSGKVLLSQTYKALVFIEDTTVSVVSNGEMFGFANFFSLLNAHALNSVSSELVNVINLPKVPFVVAIREQNEEYYCLNVKQLIEKGKILHPAFYIDYVTIPDGCNIKEMTYDSSMAKKVNISYGKYYDNLNLIKSNSAIDQISFLKRRHSFHEYDNNHKLEIHYSKRLLFKFKDDLIINIAFSNNTISVISCYNYNKHTNTTRATKYLFTNDISIFDNLSNFKEEIERNIHYKYANVFILKEAYSHLMKLFGNLKVIPPILFSDRSHIETNKVLFDKKMKEISKNIS